jgi:thermolysin
VNPQVIVMRSGKFVFVTVGVILLINGRPGEPLRAQARPTSVSATELSDLRAWDQRVDRMVRADELRVRRTVDDPLLPGRVHERLDQFHDGIRVFGGDIARQTQGGVTVSIFGTIHPDIDIDVSPALSADDIRAIVERLSGAVVGRDRVPELVILPDGAGGYRLTYRVKVFTALEGTEYFIDAKTGGLVRQRIGAQRQTSVVGSGAGVLGDQKKISITSQSGTFVATDRLRPPALNTYDARGNVTKVLNYLNGVTQLAPSDLATSTSSTWTDGVSLDAHAYIGYVYDYYFKRFGRRGLDNKNIGLISIVHPVRRNDIFTQPNEIVGLFYLNAFYAGDGIMVFGEGLPPGLVTLPGRQSWNFLAGGLDVIGHELTHGVTEFSSNLIYENESGALNEAFSDIMGTSIEFFYQPTGTGQMQADYLIGEDVITPGGLRSLSNPAAMGDPDHYSKRYVGDEDNGGIHTNSTIAGHAFYLAIEGGTNRTSGLAVQGVGAANREQMEKVFYRGFTQLMPANATFAVARTVTIQAARDLYGVGGAVERAVTQAWAAVGVN